MNKLKILILIRNFGNNLPKHKHLFDSVTAIEDYADVEYWYNDGNIFDILDKISFKPDFIYHYDMSWGYAVAPEITGLDKVSIPKGCLVGDVHYLPQKRIEYIEKNNINIIFSLSKYPFLKVFPQYESKFRWLPHSINENYIKDWKLDKTIDFLLMGQLYYEDEKNPPKQLPPKGRYKFRDTVLERMKHEKGFTFHPHPGHRAKPSENLIINEKYGCELNKSKIFFTCGSILKGPVKKFFEAPGCKTLLLAEPNKDILELGFKDGINFVACDETDFYDKAMYYIRNDKERKRITNNGYKFIHTYHTDKIRSQQFLKYIKDYLDKNEGGSCNEGEN
ncbi:MAG: glycosyltransferase family 1 protein [Firmicutes bacterium]|nr:glycosyltransferase family 1 protein [Bacillota bacterium]